MATIYRRNRGLSPTQLDDASGPEHKDGSGARRWWGWGHRRRRNALTALGDASPLSVRNPIINGVVGSNGSASSARRFVSHRVSQILWLAVLVYAFLGLPVLGRILNFLRYAHRFSLSSVLKSLVTGLFQDVAIFFQASTLICVVKLLFQDSLLLPFRASGSSSAASSSAAMGDRSASWLRTGDATSSAAGAAPTLPSRSVRLPVYMPVLTNEHDLSSDDTPSDSFGKHTTLLASSSVPGPTASYLSSLAPRGSVCYATLRRVVSTSVTVVLIQVVVVAATVASVVDFCLQVTMHPRLNRAFVEIFVNYAAQFTASLGDEEVVTRTVVWSWTVYVALVLALTLGFYRNKLPLLPSVFFAPNFFSACCACGGSGLHLGKRKDSMLSSTAASAAAAGGTTGDRPCRLVAALLPARWFAPKTLPPPALPRSRRRSGQSQSLYAHQHASQQAPSLLAYVFGCSAVASASASGASSAAFAGSAKPSPPVIVLRSLLSTTALTAIALTASLMVDGKGVDMKLMSNALFALETEGFFVKPTTFRLEEINCTRASQALLATLDPNELYETDGLGNDDHCALLWRKTIGYSGATWFDFPLQNVTTTTTAAGAAVAVGDAHTALSPNASTATPETTPTTKVALPNIIVINMESWRALDTGVLGGAARKAASGKSATPEFDALAQTGILYRKHYTQCVQTTRTLLTQLFGMLPSCTETTALKRYATSLNVRGLPQFLKARGYSTMFWSAVNLSWEYWDKFLLLNGFDKLVDDRKVRKLLHDVRDYKNQDDDHFSWGMHDDLSFEMLLYAIEAAHNATAAQQDARNATVDYAALNATGADAAASGDAVNGGDDATAAAAANATAPSSVAPTPASLRRGRPNSAAPAKSADATKSHARGWEGLQEPYFIDMYTITSHNPWALPRAYRVPDLSELYTPYTKKYIDAMYFSDDMLGRFIRAMRAKGLMANTVVVIQGDHGYGRMEHNNPSIADSGIYDEGAHVPFLLLADDFLAEHERGLQVDQLTMQSDLMATIADIIGVSPDAPLYQHGYGHSMKRRRAAPSGHAASHAPRAPGGRTTAVDAVDIAATVKDADREDASAPERRVLMCNPFNGMTKGVRTEARKYAFFPDGAFKVFEPASDPGEKNPVRAGFDVETMDADVQAQFAFATEHVDLNQFLFEVNKFSTPLPPPPAPVRRPPLQHVERMPIQVEQHAASRAAAERPSLEPRDADVAAQHAAPAVSPPATR